MGAYAELQEAAQASAAAAIRIIVQVGHCSQAVGAAEVAEALREALSGHLAVELVVDRVYQAV